LATAGPSARRIARSRQRPRRPSSSIPTAIRRVDQNGYRGQRAVVPRPISRRCDSQNATGYVRNPGETRSRACDRWPRSQHEAAAALPASSGDSERYRGNGYR
jgi:hypothetical protein